MAEPRESHIANTDAPSVNQEGDTTAGSHQVELPPREPARVPPLHLSDDEGETDAGTPSQSMPAPKVPGYEILTELGRGGMGVVYQARQLSLNRMVALKMIRAGDLASPQELARFKREAEAVARLKHPNIVQIYEVSECDGRPFFSLEYVDGGNLARMIRGVPQPPRLAAQLIETLARAVHAAHQCGIIHRDLKPANILLANADTASGDDQRTTPESPLAGYQPKIADFGLAKRLDLEGQTQSGTVMGTPGYMAPEQAAGKAKEIGPAVDVYALGAIFYQLLTGQPPYLAESREATRQLALAQDSAPPRRWQRKRPRDLQTICLKCLDQEPRKRFSTALELADDLRRYLDGKPIRSRPVGRVERLWRWSRRNPGWAAMCVLAALMMIAGIGIAVYEFRLARKNKIAETLKVLDKGIDLCEKGEIGQGMLWLARSLELAPTDDDDLDRLIRGNLAAWGRQVNRLKAILPHESKVRAVAFSPDGKTIVTGCADGSAKLWDTDKAEAIGLPLRHDAQVLAVAFGPDGKTILTGCADHIARLWDRDTRKVTREFRHQDNVLAVALSPDGETVLTGSVDRTAQLWKATTGKPIGGALQHQEVVYAVAFSPDGKIALTGSKDTTAKFWNALTGDDLRRVLRHKGPVYSVAFSPHDGNKVLTGGSEAQLWEVDKLSPIGLPVPHQGTVTSVAFSCDPRLFLTCENNVARLWERGSGKPFGTPLYHQGNISSATFSPDGKMVLTGGDDQTGRLWHVASSQAPKLLLKHKEIVEAVAFSRDGKMVVTGSADQIAQVWDTTKGEPLGAPLQHKGAVVAVAFSPDGEKVITGSWDKTAQLWESRTGIPRGEPLIHLDRVSAVAFSPDGKSVLTASWDETVRLWNPAMGARQALTLQHDNSVFAVALSHDSRTALTGSSDGTAKLWDTTSGIAIGAPLDHQGAAVHAVALSRDGKLVLTGSADGKARLWNPFTAERLQTLPHHDLVFDVAFSPDSGTALTASWDKTARMWKTANGKPQGDTLHHQGRVLSASFSPDGRLVATGGADHAARLWDAVTGKPLGPALRHGGLVRKVAFGPDSNLLLTGSADNFGRLWEVPRRIDGSVQQLSLWAQLICGMQLDDTGAIRILDFENWDHCGQRMDQFGGQPMRQ
jgi:eukaryotic-like serine/threonine-protein kinase